MVDSDVLTAVSKAVHKALNVPIYLEFKENNITFPCAYIKVIEPSMNRHVGELHNISLDLDIMYYANNLDVVTDTRKLIDIPRVLYQLLEFVQVGERTIMGTGMKYKISDGVLHFFVTYENILRAVSKPIDHMKRMELTERLKDG
ncbi:phage tail terminator family protein [Veillonella parvula]|jgi:hypothetical protein|uniref:phage tail terminator family protein n=1 Tax=Veillonella parvula TaxID=29466 RepID=UPI00195FB789|nr:hypothetical protein [Veillonella parvula]VTY47503.1 Uncharacterised protein [Veillonella parvula]